MTVDSQTAPQTQDASLFKRPKVYIIGVGMTAFTKPLASGKGYPELVREAAFSVGWFLSISFCSGSVALVPICGRPYH
uniref:Uncharacterized protein n=1 Tax=Meloidogyne enterolobii TaxID=390850 RepID=A0A6V7U3X0_MELEN|nr:unnamed protein product [Meloidogyne enterolobii]